MNLNPIIVKSILTSEPTSFSVHTPANTKHLYNVGPNVMRLLRLNVTYPSINTVALRW